MSNDRERCSPSIWRDMVSFSMNRILWFLVSRILVLGLVALVAFLAWRGLKGGATGQDASETVSARVELAATQASNDAPGAGALAPETSPVPFPHAQRVLVFALIVLLLPILTISFIRLMVSRHSNRVNAFTLGTYTAIDLIFDYFLVGAPLVTTGSVVAFLAAAVFALFYNVTLMNYALRLEDR